LRRTSRFLIVPNPFLHFCDSLPFEEDLALYLNKLEFPLYPRIICTKFDCIWLAGSEEDFFFKILSAFLLFCYYLSPWRRAIAFILTNLNSLPPRMICEVWLIGPVVKLEFPPPRMICEVWLIGPVVKLESPPKDDL
jgi:hypothetical protein